MRKECALGMLFLLLGALAWPAVEAAPRRPIEATPPMPSVLTIPADHRYVGWFAQSTVDEDSDTPAIFRAPGDRYSRFYYVETGDAGTEGYNDFRTEDGRLLAHLPGDSMWFGVRRTSAALHYFIYRSPEDRPRYDVVTIAGGKAIVHRCVIDEATVKTMLAGAGYDPKYTLAEFPWVAGPDIVDALQRTEPALVRDHCRQVPNGANTPGVVRMRPVLRQVFPKVGDLVELDERGFKGGWIFRRASRYGSAGENCCVLHFLGENRDAIIIADEFPHSTKMRVRMIFFIEDIVFYSDQCTIDGREAAVAVGDADWKSGRAYFVEGVAPRIVPWSGVAPEGCRRFSPGW